MQNTQFNAEVYASQLQVKANILREQFSCFDLPELEIFASPPANYRMRAEFRVWHDGDDLYHIMFDQQTKQKYPVHAFPQASELINQVMDDLILLLKTNDIARRKLFQIDYLSSMSQQIVVSLLYHKSLDESWHQQMSQILQQLRHKYTIDIIGRAKGQKILLDKDYLNEELTIAGKTFHFKQTENSFTQPNASVNIKMIEWALNVSQACRGDLLELYCGLGNFTLPLAQNFRRILATEIAKSSVAAAQDNIAKNQIDNVTILRMSSEEFVQALQQKRQFRRLEGIDLNNFDCQTIFVDPPRSGLDQQTVEMVKYYTNIIYISCNPTTLMENLQTLCNSHSISRFALFDQFPYTHHTECGVFLQKRLAD